MLTQCTPNAHPVHTWRFIRKAHVCELLCLLTYFNIVGHEYQKHQLFHIKKNKSNNLDAFFIAIFNIFSITAYTMQPLFEHFIFVIMGSVKGLLSDGHQAITGTNSYHM